MRSITLLALGLAAVVAASCGDRLAGTLPVGPTALEPGAALASSAAFSPLAESRVPPLVVPEGISCPSDAPVVMIGAFGTRIDVEWSAIPRVLGYEVTIEARQENGQWALVHQTETTRVRAEWTGRKGITYRARVRSHVCGAFGQWSPYQVQTIDADPYVKTPQPPVTPPGPCATVQSLNGAFAVSLPCEPPCGFAVAQGPCEPPCGFAIAVVGCEPEPDPEPECPQQFGLSAVQMYDPCAPAPCDTGYWNQQKQKGHQQKGHQQKGNQDCKPKSPSFRFGR